MSTKVYNLYRYTGDIASCLAWLKALRVDFLKKLRTELSKYTRLQQSSDIYNCLVEMTRAGYRSPFNIDNSVCVYLHDNQVYVHFFCTEHLLDACLDTSHLIDCSYWDQSDKPDEISDEEWKARARFVEAIDVLDTPCSRVGFVFIISDENDAPEFAYGQ